MDSKDAIRKWILEQRKSLSKEEVEIKSGVIFDKLIRTNHYKQASCIYLYLDAQNEVRTRPIIECAWREGKRIAIPKVKKEGLKFYYIENFDGLTTGSFGILEPKENHLAMEFDALMIMPGLAFDKENHRIGFGAGYYDKYLSQMNQHYKIALAYQFQIFDHVPYVAHDICPDMILTE